MHVVLLRFSANKSAAAAHMDGHQQWVQQGVDDGTFALVGSIEPSQGGAVIATGIDREALGTRIQDDPFVAHDVVTAEVVEITPNLTDPRLAFLGE